LIAIFKDYGLAAIALALALRPLTTLGAHVFTVNLILPGRKITFLKSVVSGLLLYGIVLVIETSLKTSHQPLRIAPVVALAFIALATAHRVKCEWTALKS
jgi:hypothetical protein